MTEPKYVDPHWMTPREAVKFLRMSLPTIRKLIADKKIPCYRFGGRWRFERNELKKWVESHKQEVQ